MYSNSENKTIEKAPDRIEVLNKIKELERAEIFDKDVENDPPTIELLPNKVDYLQKKLSSKINRLIANKMGRNLINNLVSGNTLIIKDISGLENFDKVKGGAVITCNHFSANDSFLMQILFDKVKKKRQRMYKVINEGNYTNPPCFKQLFRNCDVLPLSSNLATMKKFINAVNVILQRGDYILFYPEGSMWWNYRKPRPLKDGAFKFACKNNVPIIPVFITMEDTENIGPDGFPIQAHTIHVLPPIYKDSTMANSIDAYTTLKNLNFAVWKKTYKNFYKKELKYSDE